MGVESVMPPPASARPSPAHDAGVEGVEMGKVKPPLRGAKERNGLFAANAGLAPACLMRLGFSQAHPDWDDLLQAAFMGVLRAAELFDEANGARFSTYADWWIRQRVQQWREGAQRHAHLSLDALEEGAGPFAAGPGVEAAPDAGDVVRRAMAFMPPRERAVLRLRFLKGLTLTQAGERLGVSKERIRQIQGRALGWLRRRMGADAA